MKAILLVDMPKRCEECPLRYDYVVYYDKCGHDMIDCPLKPIPQKILDRYESPQDYRDGWNDCVDEILRGEE